MWERSGFERENNVGGKWTIEKIKCWRKSGCLKQNNVLEENMTERQ